MFQLAQGCAVGRVRQAKRNCSELFSRYVLASCLLHGSIVPKFGVTEELHSCC